VISEQNQAIGIAEREWPEKNAFNQREDRGGRADAERQGEDGGDGETRRPDEAAEGETQVA
jgi:hypothetical protein